MSLFHFVLVEMTRHTSGTQRSWIQTLVQASETELLWHLNSSLLNFDLAASIFTVKMEPALRSETSADDRIITRCHKPRRPQLWICLSIYYLLAHF